MRALGAQAIAGEFSQRGVTASGVKKYQVTRARLRNNA
jgi:hypothetical protein